jgi:signal transduction histidine kinase
MRRLLLNVCDNAAQAMGPQGGLLELSLQPERYDSPDDLPNEDLVPGGYAVLRVTSRADGESPELEAQAIFDPSLVHTKGRDFEFDLSIARLIAILNGGALDARREGDTGAFITIYLPAATGFEGDKAVEAAGPVSVGIAETFREK